MENNKKHSLNAISEANSDAYMKLAPVFRMPADGMTIAEAVEVGKSVSDVIRAMGKLGKTLASLDGR